MQPNRPVSTDVLLHELWADRPPGSAVKLLHGYVAQLRRLLGAETLLTRAPGYQLVAGPGEVDADRFDELVARGRRALGEGAYDEASARLGEALRLWRGAALADLPAIAPAAHAAAARLEASRLAAVETRIEAELACGRHAALLPELEVLVTEHPLHEGLRRALMVALYRSGRQTDALAAYRDLRRVLVEELGVEPSPELRQVERAILTADASLAAKEPITRRSPPPRQLPPDPVAFTGRERELGALRSLLARDSALICAISGPAGIGKSALAVHVAHEHAARFPDGQLYIDLQGSSAGLSPLTATEALGRFLRALGVDSGGLPAEVDEAAALLRSVVADRRVLLVLDNAAGAAQVRPLLVSGTRCAVLITSRSVLATVDGLEHLQLDTLAPEESVALLACHAGTGRVVADAEAARLVAARCGHLPLALRIAGARLAARPGWPLSALAARLGDEQARLDELAMDDLAVRATFAVSHAALDAASARLFGLLGLLDVGEVSLALVAVLAGRSSEPELERLVDAQLLQAAAPGRYRMHDLLRLFARECSAELPVGERRDAVERAIGWYVTVAEHAADLLRAIGTGGDIAGLGTREDALAWLEAERANLLAVAAQAASSVPALVGRLARAGSAFLTLRGYWPDAVALSELAVATACGLGDEVGAAEARNDLGAVLWRLGRLPEAAEMIEQNLALYRRTGDRRGLGDTLSHLGIVYRSMGRAEEAIECWEQGLAIVTEIGDWRRRIGALTNLGIMHQDMRRYAEAISCYERALPLCRENGDTHHEGLVLINLAHTQHLAGDLVAAADSFERSLVRVRAAGERLGEGKALWGLGDVLRDLGELDAARERWRAALAILTELGAPDAADVAERLDGS